MQLVPICLVAYVVGMLAGTYLSPGTAPILFWSAPFLSAGLCLLFRGRRPVAFCFLLLTFSLVGLVRVPLHLNPPTDTSQVHLYCSSSPLLIEGTVLRVNLRGPDQSSVDIASQLVSSQGIAAKVSGRVRVYIDSGRPELLYGDRVRFRSRLRQPRTFGTPGEFDMPRYLAYAGIRATAYLSDKEHLVRIAGKNEGLLRQIDRWRQQGGLLIDRVVPETIAPLVRALALGERGALPVTQRQGLARGGVAHLFAISGLHMGLLALFGYQVLLIVYRRSARLLRWQPPQRVLPLLLLPLLLGYLVLTGDALSTRRAFAACFCIAVFLMCKRRVAPLSLLSTLALLFLLLEPLALWQASFQLSFAGVAGILCWRRYWQLEGFERPWLLKRVLQIFLVSLAATLATAPLVMLNFHLFTPAGLVNNLFAIPLVTLLAVPAGLMALLLTVCWPAWAGIFYALCGQVLQLTVGWAEQVSLIPGLGGELLYLSHWQLTWIALVVLTLLIPWRRLRYPLLILPVMLLLLIAPVPTGEPGVSLTAFSVGQGESMLLTIDGRKHVLIDGGGLYSDSFDVGERLLAPALGLLGVKRLDAVLLTHDHPDHSKGLLYLLEHFPVEAFWCGTDREELSWGLQQVLRQQQIPVRRFNAGWTAVSTHSGGALYLYVPELAQGSKNDLSVALYVNRGEDGLLLTGDLEQKGTAALLGSGVPGPVSLLKLPHHGSRHSGSPQLLEQLHPQQVLVSVGYQNHYRFPAAEVVADVIDSNATLYRTDLSGTLRFKSQGRGWQAERWNNGLFR